VYTDIGITPESLKETDRARYEKVFLETYNDISFHSCDQFFRVVSEVGLVVSGLGSVTGRQQPWGNDTASTEISEVVFEVSGRCRNCVSKTRNGAD